MRIIKRLILIIFILVLAAAGVVVYSYFDQNKLSYELYHLYSDKVAVGENIRVIALADLHNKEFGKDNAELIEEVARMKPDIIVIAGDMVDKSQDNTSTALNLCLRLKEIAPLYYGFGNHESNMVYVQGIRFDEELKAAGINLLINSAQTLNIKDTDIDIGSVATGSDDDEYERYSADFVKEFEDYEPDTHLKLMITHFPSLYYDKMKDAKFDLGICGHLHGGQIRLPIVGGLYAEWNHKIELFPKYCYGKFELDNCTIIVSRGLGNHEIVPRINNRPEITVIDINSRPELIFGRRRRHMYVTSAIRF